MGSKYDSKKNCPGSFTKSATWKGYSVCKGKPTRPVRTTKPIGGEVACGAMSKGVRMGYNIKCFSSTLANCKAQCKKTKDCKMAEYAKGSKTCCTSKYDSKKKLSRQLHQVGYLEGLLRLQGE